MKTVTRSDVYQCEKCKANFSTPSDALECEKRPIKHDRGVKVGDIVGITNGQSAGEAGTVTSVFIFDKNWGHYAWERYWHTVGLVADIIGSSGSRQLTFDDYIVKPE